MTNESYWTDCLFRHLEDNTRQLDMELTCCTLTPAQHTRLEEIIGRLSEIAAKRKPKVA